MGGRRNWDKVRQQRLLSKDVGPLEPDERSWEPLPSIVRKRRAARSKRRTPAGRSTKAAEPNAPTSASSDRPSSAAPLPPQDRQPAMPFVKTSGRSSIDVFFQRVRDAQAAASPSRSKPHAQGTKGPTPGTHESVSRAHQGRADPRR